MKLLRFLPRFREAQRQLDCFADRETWSGSDVAEYQLEQLNRLWLHARTSVPYYAELAKRRKLPERFASLKQYSEEMPILAKSKVQADGQQFLSTNKAPGRWHRTGGSTGIPTAIYWEYEAHRHVLRSKYRNEQSHGIDIFDKKAFLWGHGGSFSPGFSGFKQKLRRPIEDWLRNRLRVSAYDLSEDSLRQGLEQMIEYMPKSLYGYSSAIDLLARVAADAALEIPQLEIALLTAEPCDAEMRARVSQRLRCRAVLEYGAAECAYIAGQSPSGDIRVRDDVIYLETIRNEAGTYDIVITVLGNRSFPLLRYAIEDSTTSSVVRPTQGFAVMADIQGRRNDMLVSCSGRRLHAMLIKHTLEHYPQIRRFTAFQNANGEMLITLEAKDVVPESLQELLQSQFVEMLDGFPVTINQVPQIPGNAAGKHRWIRSEMSLTPVSESRS